MKKYDIWSKSYDGYESYHGQYRGSDFKDAVNNFKCDNPDPHIRGNINLEELTFFGNKFYGKEISYE